jgi:hypothetical protein
MKNRSSVRGRLTGYASIDADLAEYGALDVGYFVPHLRRKRAAHVRERLQVAIEAAVQGVGYGSQKGGNDAVGAVLRVWRGEIIVNGHVSFLLGRASTRPIFMQVCR